MRKILILVGLIFVAAVAGILLSKVGWTETEVTAKTTKVGLVLSGYHYDGSYCQFHYEALQAFHADCGELAQQRGGLLLNLEQFALFYRFIRQFYKRYGGTVVKLMFILTENAAAGERSYSLLEAVDKFGLCLQDTLRKSDMILRHKPNQFFVLLQNLSEEDFQTVFRRIMDAWEAGEHHSGIQIEYLMEYVIYEKENYDK